jgi:cytochrome c
MGFRNPYRIHPDVESGRLFIGEFGPAAGKPGFGFDTARGPDGADQIKITDSAGFFGYPYFLKDNKPYCHYNYATSHCDAIVGQASLRFDPLRPANYSKNNTGLRILPPAKPALLWENDKPDVPDSVPGLKGCGWGAGPVYHFDPALNAPKSKFPPYFDGKWLFFPIFPDNGNVDYKGRAKLVAFPGGKLGAIRASQVVDPPWTGNPEIIMRTGIHDMEFGADGALYVVDYGDGFYSDIGGQAVYRIRYEGCVPPLSLASAAAGRKVALRIAVWAGGILEFPAGSQAAALYDFRGRRLGEFTRTAAEGGRMRLPAGMGNGVLWVQFR